MLRRLGMTAHRRFRGRILRLLLGRLERRRNTDDKRDIAESLGKLASHKTPDLFSPPLFFGMVSSLRVAYGAGGFGFGTCSNGVSNLVCLPRDFSMLGRVVV